MLFSCSGDVECSHSDADGNSLCDKCGESCTGGDEPSSEPGDYSKGLNFVLNPDEKSYSVAGIGTCTDTDIIIPSQHKGLPVTEIGDSAFNYSFTITSVTIPISVTKINSHAFQQCSTLKEITVSDANATHKSLDGNLSTVAQALRA